MTDTTKLRARLYRVIGERDALKAENERLWRALNLRKELTEATQATPQIVIFDGETE